MPSTETKSKNENSGNSEIAAGISLGLLVGVLLGLSLTPGSTSTALGALVAILATFFGLVKTTDAFPIRPANDRIIAFCIACLIATTGGIYVRTHNLLSPQPSFLLNLTNELHQIGYTDDKIREMINTRYFSAASSPVAFPGIPASQQTGTNLIPPWPNQ
jgi:hypothetical protein